MYYFSCVGVLLVFHYYCSALVQLRFLHAIDRKQVLQFVEPVCMENLSSRVEFTGFRYVNILIYLFALHGIDVHSY